MGLRKMLGWSRELSAKVGGKASHYLARCGLSHRFEGSRFLDLLLEDALHLRATDIHIVPADDEVQIRVRIDGALRNFVSLQPKYGKVLIQRVKVVSGMDFLDYWEAQDGAGEVTVCEQRVAFRASTMPVKSNSVAAERLIIRLYWKRDFDLARLDLDPVTLATWRELIAEPQGMLVLTGPANSGKTTTLYSSLMEIQRSSRGERNIATVEDPVEFPVPGLSQSQVNAKDNFGFADALRALMRQDPQVIMVGEIRDPETASMAINASLTGHLILTTVHSKQVTGIFPRLQSLGIDPVRAASSILAVLNQRLVRLNCRQCAAPYLPDRRSLAYFPEEVTKAALFRRGSGCDSCAGTGFFDRSAVSELLVLDRDLRSAICAGLPSQDLYDRAIGSGMATIWQNAMKLVWSGGTPLEETVQIVGTDGE